MAKDAKAFAEQWVRPEIRALSAYHVQDASGFVKLDAMENPFTWPDALRDEWAELIKHTNVNRYPDPHAQTLTKQIAKNMGVPEGMRVMLGNGSDELIQMIAMSLSGDNRAVMSVEPSFVMYRMIATFCDMQYVGVNLNTNDFSLDTEAMLTAIKEHNPAVIFLAYPNNPTTNLFDADGIKQIIEAAEGLVVVDEAYAPFTDESFMPLLGQYPNLVVMRTVSKMGLAGLRLGLLAGPAEWLNEFDKVRLPYNINVLTQASADFALKHQATFDEQTQLLRKERDRVIEGLSQLSGVKVYPSDANFILMRTPEGKARPWFEALKAKGILIKNLDGGHPMLIDCLRPTIGTPDENDAFLSAMREIAA
jgi:histidinol-phosphate aminotransferase